MFRLLAVRYGLEGGRLQSGGREGSVWWREIVNICDGFGLVGGAWYPKTTTLILAWMFPFKLDVELPCNDYLSPNLNF
jgi:hypothetical protein